MAVPPLSPDRRTGVRYPDGVRVLAGHYWRTGNLHVVSVVDEHEDAGWVPDFEGPLRRAV